MTGTLTAGLVRRLADRPHQPRLTYYDADGNRTELSTASLVNWAAKVAGLLTVEVGAVPGAVVRVHLPPGWLHLPVLLGAWWAGLTVTHDDDPDAVAAFVAPGADAAADEVFAVSAHPFGLAVPGLPSHQRDLADAARLHADRFTPPTRLPEPLLAVPGLTVDELLARADGAEPDARLLTSSLWTLPDPGASVLLAPLMAGGSLVQVHPALPDDAVAQLAVAEKAHPPPS